MVSGKYFLSREVLEICILTIQILSTVLRAVTKYVDLMNLHTFIIGTIPQV